MREKFRGTFMPRAFLCIFLVKTLESRNTILKKSGNIIPKSPAINKWCTK